MNYERKNEMKFRVLMYKAKFDGHPIDDMINLWTGLHPKNWGTGNYSHTEVWIPDEYGCFEGPVMHPTEPVYARNNYLGQCFTSTMRGENNGVVIRPASDVLKNTDRWDYFEIEVSEYFLKIANNWALQMVAANKGYDKMSLLSFILPFRFGPPDKYICSEIVLRYIQMACLGMFYDKKHVPSPRRLAKWLQEEGYGATPLSKVTQ